MRRKCDGTDPSLLRPEGDGYKPCDCGLVFDDIDHLVIYPHDWFPAKTIRCP